MADTVQDILKDSLRILGVAQSGQSLPANEVQDGIRALKDVIAAMGIDGTLGPLQDLVSVPITGAASYTVGEGGAINIAFPYELRNAWYVNANTNIPLPVYAVDDFRQLFPYQMTGAPVALTYLATYPLGKLMVQGNNLASGQLMLEFTGVDSANLAIDSVLSINPARLLYIKYRLAERLAPEYETTLSADARLQLSRAESAVRADQLQLSSLYNPAPGVYRFYNIRTNRWR
jgi:hypothetical protein